MLWRFFLARKKTAANIATTAIAGQTGKASLLPVIARGSAVPEAVISRGTEVSESSIGTSEVTEYKTAVSSGVPIAPSGSGVAIGGTEVVNIKPE